MANLAAANHYKKEHLLENWKTVESAEMYYISVREAVLKIIIIVLHCLLSSQFFKLVFTN